MARLIRPNPGSVPTTARSVVGRLLALVLVVLWTTALVPTSSASSAEQAAPPEEKTATVNLLLGQMLPQQVEVTTGTTVTWVSMEPAEYPLVGGTHVLVADDSSFASPPIAPGTRWSHRFNKPGTFTYRCKNHTLTTGEILVTGTPVADTLAEQEVAITETNPDDPTSWGFQPADLIVQTGTTVVWRNNGKNTHTVTANDGSFDSADIAPGATFRRTFDAPGVFAYHCTPHPWMKAMVRVVVPGGPPPEAPPPVEHGSGAMGDMGDDPAPQTRTGTGPARLRVDILEPDPANPNSWRFSPSLLDMRTGDTVVWHNRGSMAHTVTSETGLFDSGLIQPGQTWERTFDRPGVFAYRCTPHPWMRAKLGVAEPGKAAPVLTAASGTATAGAAATAALLPVRRAGSGPVRVPVNIVEPDIADAMSWGFSPQVVDVKAGDTVVWRNTGTLQHTVTSDKGDFESGLLASGATFERRFDSPSAYAYRCTPHPWMKGVVRVTSAEGGAPPPLPELTAAAGPGEQATGPLGTQTQPGAIGLPRVPLGEPFNSSNRPFFFSLLAMAAVLALTWFFAATPWRPRPEGSKIRFTGPDAGQVRW